MGMKNEEQQGGLSGKPLQHKSTEVIKRLHQELKGQIPIIGSGGIDDEVLVITITSFKSN